MNVTAGGYRDVISVEYTKEDAKYLYNRLNMAVADASTQLIEPWLNIDEQGHFLTPPINEDGKWCDTWTWDSVYKALPLNPENHVTPTPLIIEFANGFQFIPRVLVSQQTEKVKWLVKRCLLLQNDEKSMYHGCRFLYGGTDMENMSEKLILLQHTPTPQRSLEDQDVYYDESFIIEPDFGSVSYELYYIIPVFFQRIMYLMIYPKKDKAVYDKKLITDGAYWKRLIVEEQEQRRLYRFD